MTLDRAFRRDILAHPEDTSHLAYADWLDDHGHAARAEFIRLQIHLAQQDEAARLLARAPLLEGLTELVIDAYGLTESNLRRLRDRFSEALTLLV